MMHPVQPAVGNRPAIQPRPALAQSTPVFQGRLPQDSLSLRFQGGVEGAAPVGKPDFIKDLQERGVAVLGGAGIMGSGIILNYITSGIPAYMYDINDGAIQGGVSRVNGELDSAMVPRKPGMDPVMSTEEAEAARGLLKGTMTDLAAIDPQQGVNPGIVIEAVFENMDLKKQIFKQLDAQLHPDTILATNTSSLSVAEMAKATNRPDKVIGIHFFKPANRNRFIEIIPGPETSQDTVTKAMALARALGKTPILCGDGPGFVVNRMLIPAMNEGVKMLDEGVANTKTIEQAFMQTVWPTMHKRPEVAKKLLGPFGGQNQDNYIQIIGQTTQVLHNGLKERYGDAYKPTQTVVDKLKAYNEALERSKANGTPLKDELAATVHYKLDGEVDTSKLAAIQNRFLGQIFGVASQIVAEGVSSKEDVDRGVQAALKWEIGPFEMMNKIGPKKALALAEAYAKTNPGFTVPELLKTQAKLNKPFDLSLVDTRKEGSTQYIVLNRPQAAGLNYLSPAMLQNLRDAFRAAEKDPNVNEIVFESIGGKAFVSGADIIELDATIRSIDARMKASPIVSRLPRTLRAQITNTVKYLNTRPFIKQGADVFTEIANSKKVTISKLNGLALGGGLELPLACDYIVASDKVKAIGLPEVKYGIFPAWGGTERLTSRIGAPLARWMVLEGGLMGKGGKGPAILDAQQAKAIGVVDEVVPALSLDQAVREKIASGAFSQKRNTALPKDGDVLSKLSGRWAELHARYADASLKDLAAKELKGLYLPAAALADKRLTRTSQGLGSSRFRDEADWLRMALNMDAVQRLERKAAAAKKS